MKALSTQLGLTTGVFHLEGGKIPVTSDYRQIVRGQIIDALTTNARERVMRPDYGADIRSLLFDGADALVRGDVANAVKDRLGILVPRASVKTVILTSDPGTLQLRGIDTDGTNLVCIDVEYTTRVFEESLAVVVLNNVGGSS